MKEFNLDAALNGEPVNASGKKCYIVSEVTEFLDDQRLRRFVVIFPDNHTDAEIWYEHDLIDDIGMWEEPKISVEDLPKPFKPKFGERFYYVYGSRIENLILNINSYDEELIESGNCFRTKEDAQKWLDFMKSMIE